MKIPVDDFRVPEGKALHLGKRPTRVERVYDSDKEYQAILHDHVERMDGLQQLLYASNRYAVLLIFQAMDAAGKDGVIRHVMSGINPQGCQVFSYKQPSASELAHDFLWRTARDLPERGHIGIFNRSYYEEVLIVRVHPEILKGENLPHIGGKIWEHRLRSIRDFERHLHANGTRIVKFFLHLSKEEQRKRFLARIDDLDKNWKLDPGDIEERNFWKDYMRAYKTCLEATSTVHASWYAVPADDKENARLIVSQIILNTLEGLDMHYPKTSPGRRRQLQAIRHKLAKEAR